MEPNPSAPTEAKSSTRRRPLAPQEITGDDPKSREERVILELMRALNIGKLIAFTGSGVSAVYGLPTWPELCEKTASACWKQTCTIDKNSKIYSSIEAIRTKLLDELLLRRLQKLHSEAFEALSEKFRAPLSDIELLSYADAALGMLESSQEDAELDTAKNILAEIAQPYCVRERMTKEAAFGVLSDLVGPDAEKLLQGI